MTNDEMRQLNDRVIQAHIARAAAIPEERKYECPVCHTKASVTPNEACIACAITALKKFGWEPL